MNVVLLHDWLTGMRGGERVLEAFCELFPKAPLYTLIHEPRTTSTLIENRKIHTSFLNDLPGIKNHYRKFLPLFPAAANQLQIKERADLVLSSSHCVIKAVRKPSGAKHLTYIHSPMRYIYDQFDVYFGKSAPLSQRLVAPMIRGYLTRFDLQSNSNVDVFVANSHFVKERISKYYSREAQVIHPFVELEDFYPFQKSVEVLRDYFLMVTAFAPNKRVDVALRAFALHKLKNPAARLVIVGSGQQERYLKALAVPGVEFLGTRSRPEIIKLYFGARAFIFPGVEDFGITPLEALAAGTPVIALKEGGVLETLTPETATFFEGGEVELAQAMNQFRGEKFQKQNLFDRASHFSKKKFKEAIQTEIQKLMSTSP